MPEPSNWTQATRHLAIEAVICIKCGAQNRPGVCYIRLAEDGRYECSVCAHDWPKA